MTVISPKSNTTTTTTTSTSFKDDPIYKAHGTIIENNSTMYFRIKKGPNFLVNNDNTVISRNLNKSSPYSEQIKKYLDDFLNSPQSLSIIQNDENFMVVDKHFVFKFETSANYKGPFKFVSVASITNKEKIDLYFFFRNHKHCY